MHVHVTLKPNNHVKRETTFQLVMELNSLEMQLSILTVNPGACLPPNTLYYRPKWYVHHALCMRGAATYTFNCKRFMFDEISYDTISYTNKWRWTRAHFVLFALPVIIPYLFLITAVRERPSRHVRANV